MDFNSALKMMLEGKAVTRKVWLFSERIAINQKREMVFVNGCAGLLTNDDFTAHDWKEYHENELPKPLLDFINSISDMNPECMYFGVDFGFESICDCKPYVEFSRYGETVLKIPFSAIPEDVRKIIQERYDEDILYPIGLITCEE